MEGKRNRGEVTAELSEKVWARLCRENALVASEVWVDDARRVDFVAYRPHRPRDRSSNHATAAERKFAAAARRAAAFREGRPKLMQDEARRAAIRETRHRVCTAPILKSIKEIHR